MIDHIPTFFSIKTNDHCASYLDAAVELLWNNYAVLVDFPEIGYNLVVEEMLEDIDVHHYPLDVDF